MAQIVHFDIKLAGPTRGSVKPQTFLSNRFMVSIKPVVFHIRPNIQPWNKRSTEIKKGLETQQQGWLWRKLLRNTKNHIKDHNTEYKFASYKRFLFYIMQTHSGNLYLHVCLCLTVCVWVCALVFCQSGYRTFGAVSE